MKNRIILIILVLLCTNISVFAKVELPSIFADGMVLQQRSDVAIWGKATPDEKITITPDWDGKRYRVVAQSDSTWRVKIATPEGSYAKHSIKIKSKEEVEINDVLIGEVWLCSGQSNMAMTMRGYRHQGIEGASKDILYSKNPYLRQYRLAEVSSVVQNYDCPGVWTSADPNTTIDFSATAYYFGRAMQAALDLPIAVIDCSWGGSTIESWISERGLKEFPDKKIPEPTLKKWGKNRTPTVLYNGMVNSIVGYGIKGAIWYQGESNRLSYDRYADYFKAMHNDWEQRWSIGEFPIYAVQIAPYGGYDTMKGINSAFMRETQLNISLTQENTGLAIILDCGMTNCIHPPKKYIAGERLSLVALAKSYGYDNVEYEAPLYNRVEFDGDEAEVYFDNAELGFVYKPVDDYTGFEIAGSDQIFHPAKASITKNQSIIVSSDLVPEPKAVRYAFKNYVEATVFGVNGLPVSSFRTDDWDQVGLFVAGGIISRK